MSENKESLVVVSYLGLTNLPYKEICLKSQVAEQLVYLETRGCTSIEVEDYTPPVSTVVSAPADIVGTQDAVVELSESVWRKMDDDGLEAAGFTSVGELLSAYKRLNEKFNPPESIFAEGEFVLLKGSTSQQSIKVDHSFVIAGEIFVLGKVVDPVPGFVVYMQSSLVSMP